MQILNLGILEVVLVLLIMLIVLGPDEMKTKARQIGRFVSRFTKSETWRMLMMTSKEIRELPTRIVREAGMEESIKEIQDETRIIAEEMREELSDTVQDVNIANQELQLATADISRQSVPVAFSMRSEPDRGDRDTSGDSEPKEAEEVSNPLETDPAEEIEEMVEDAAEDAMPDAGDRSIAPPGIIETGEDVSITDDFVRPAIEDTEGEPASKAESERGVDDDGRDFGIPPAIIEPDPDSIEDALIDPAVGISKPDPEGLITGRPMTRIPERKPGADLDKDIPPPPVDIPGEASEEDTEDEDPERPAE
jgi:sec-independent protein translocase protein TatB